jgi:transposase
MAEKFQQISELAKTTIGLRDPYRMDEFEIKALAHDLAHALGKQTIWLNNAIELLEHRVDYRLLLQLPRIGKPTAAAILTAIGDINEYKNGKQLVKLADIDLIAFKSGSSIMKRPRISHIGSAFLRHYLYHSAKRGVAHEGHFKTFHERRKKRSPGKGAGQRALVAVCDKVIRIIYRMLKDRGRYNPKRDHIIAQYYETQRKAA